MGIFYKNFFIKIFYKNLDETKINFCAFWTCQSKVVMVSGCLDKREENKEKPSTIFPESELSNYFLLYCIYWGGWV